MQSTEPPEDIPVAMRDMPVKQKPKSPYLLVWVVSGAVGAIAITILSITLWILNNPSPGSRSADAGSSGTIAPGGNPVAGNNGEDPGLGDGSPDPTQGTATQANPTDGATLLGHRAYAEAPPDTLVPILADGSLKLRDGAAQAWFAMEEAARKDGINLIVLSAYRSIEDQQYLFFEVKKERGQDSSTRAEVSAPPGYSEHHTGYAMDVGDASNPDTHLKPEFESTAAFAWLRDNATHYDFEMSFPKDNPQGISYEPWHWRFVGNQESLETFYKQGERPQGEPPQGNVPPSDGIQGNTP